MLEQFNDPPETWRPVVGYEGWYEVSDLGRVKRIAAGRAARVGLILRQSLGRNGYLSVMLSARNVQKRCSVHRLVAIAFIPCPGEIAAFEVNHIDTLKTNARRDNLEWLTPSGNSRHAYAAGRMVGMAKTRGEAHHASKLRDTEAIEIFQARGIVSQRALARRFGVTPRVIRLIHRGEAWTHVTHA